MLERDFDSWLEEMGHKMKKATGSGDAEIRVGDSSAWTSRRVSISLAGDSLPLTMSESVGSEGSLQGLSNIVILRKGGSLAVRADLLRYFPGLYVGGDIKYSSDGVPCGGGLVVELDFDVNKRGDCLRVTRNFSEGQTPTDAWSLAMDAENKKRVVLPESWTKSGDKLVYVVQVKDSDGVFAERKLEFPEKVDVEMIMEASQKKGRLPFSE